MHGADAVPQVYHSVRYEGVVIRADDVVLIAEGDAPLEDEIGEPDAS